MIINTAFKIAGLGVVLALPLSVHAQAAQSNASPAQTQQMQAAPQSVPMQAPPPEAQPTKPTPMQSSPSEAPAQPVPTMPMPSSPSMAPVTPAPQDAPIAPKDQNVASAPSTAPDAAQESKEMMNSSAPSAAPSMPGNAPITAGSNVISDHSPVTTIPITVIPSADSTLLDKATNAINSNNVDEFVSIFDSSNFVFITPKADRINNIPELKVQWATIFGSNGFLKDAKAKFTPTKMIELVPGASTYDGSLVFTTSDGKTIRAVVSGAMKYYDNAWKVVTMNFSAPDVIRINAEQESMSKRSGVSAPIMLLFSFLLGIGTMFYVGKRARAKQHNLAQQ